MCGPNSPLFRLGKYMNGPMFSEFDYSFIEATLCPIRVYVYGVILNGKYMNGSLFSEPRCMIGVGFEHPYQNDPQVTSPLPLPPPRAYSISNCTTTTTTTTTEPLRDKTNKMACAPSEDSDQPGHPPSLFRVYAVRLKKALVLSYPLSAQRRL